MLLARAEADADLLYATVRTMILAVFWGLFFLAEEGHHHDAATALTLAGYTALAAWTWLAVWRGWHGRALTIATVTADVLLVALLLAALARAADLPTGHLFALPPSGLVFLVVAHAALRFDAGIVLYAGIAAAASLLAVSILPAWQPPALRHGRHLPMADYWPVLPLAILLLTTVVIWFVARRTRRLLDVAIGEAQRAGRLARFFSPAVARRLAVGGIGAAERGDRRSVAVLFADIRGFTAMAERMPPEAVGEFLAEFRAIVTRCVFAGGGSIDKFIGDGALAVFGAPEPQPDAAARALGCARAILDAVAAWSAARAACGLPPVQVAIGAHHGEVFAGIVGGEAVLEFTVLGDTVNVAERLQRVAADRGAGLVLSDAFRHACGEAFDGALFAGLGALDLPGRVDRVTAWRWRGHLLPVAAAEGSAGTGLERVSEAPA